MRNLDSNELQHVYGGHKGGKHHKKNSTNSYGNSSHSYEKGKKDTTNSYGYGHKKCR